MRICFLVADVPTNGGSGGQIASWRLLEAYRSLGDVDVLVLAPERAAPPPRLQYLANRIEVVNIPGFHASSAPVRTLVRLAHAQLGGAPYRVAKFANRRAAHVLVDWQRDTRYDVVHCDQLATASYRKLFNDTPAILMEQNVEWEIFERLAEEQSSRLRAAALRRESRRTANYDAQAIGCFDHVFALSERDASLLAARRPDLAHRISVWPIPIDAPSAPLRRGGSLRVVVIGSLRSVGRLHGLRWFLQEVWPRVYEADRSATLDIIGAAPAADVLAQHGRSGILVHGFVDDLEPFLDRASVCAIPLFIGGGIRVKVLEMLARGIPCVGTEVALQGLTDLRGTQVVGPSADWAQALQLDSISQLASEAIAAAAELSTSRSAARSADVLRSVVETVAHHPARGESSADSQPLVGRRMAS